MKIGTSTVTAIYLGTTSIVSAYLGSTQVFGGASAFTPLDLFSTGAQGIWLDPSDLSTMFSDRAGTTPVTAPGTVVGLRLDKSKGLVLGSELVVNGTFDANVTGWSAANGGTLSWDAGRAKVVVSSFGQGVTQTSWSPVAGRWYRVTFTITNGAAVARNFALTFGGFALDNQPINAGQSQTFTVTCLTNSTANLIIRNAGGTFVSGETFFYDNISVRELAGNHATAPTDAARPTYGVEPKGGRRNLLTYSEAFNDSIWVKGSSTVVANNSVAPDGTTTADLLYPASSGNNRWAYQVYSSTPNIYTRSVYAKASGKNFLLIDTLGDGINGAYFDLSTGTVGTVSAGYTATITAVGSGWHRCSVRNTSNQAINFGGVYAVVDADNSRAVTANGTDGILLWGGQFETGSTATAYQRVTTAYNITEAGVPTCHYVQYDGSDDSMSTAAIDFTATDKMSVFAGVRKLSDAATGMLLEISTSLAVGSLNLVVPQVSATGVMRANSRGTVSAFVDGPTQAAPASFLATIQTDIANDNLLLRLNGTQVAQATTDQGTGNFGSHPLFIGRRNNATLPFNGKDYGLIIVGKAASGTEITDTETWLSAKTSGVSI